MDSSKIKPAIKIADGHAISTNDFHRLLFQYFENKGIMCDLRAHLRSQMIRALNDTNLGKSMINKRHELSPKVQAINLLIAEYLLQRNYHYTLSVLSSEVPLSGVFPAVGDEKNPPPEAAFRFSDNDLWDILEALGATRIPDLAESLGVKYKSQAQLSLLTCILHNVPGIAERNNAVKSQAIHTWMVRNKIDNMDLEHLIRMFMETGIELDIILEVIEMLRRVITNEVTRLKELKDQEVMQLKQQFSYDAAAKLHKYKLKFTSLEALYKSEKNRLQEELKQAQDNLSSCAKHVQDKYNDVNALNEHIKLLEMRLMQQEQALVFKEHTLEQRQKCLEEKQKHFDLKFEMMKKTVSQTSQTVDCNEAKSQESPKRVESHDQRLKIENQQMQQSQNALNDEIAILRHQNSEYKMKIDELLGRTSSLLVELESRADYQWKNVLEGKKRELSTHNAPTLNYHHADEAPKPFKSNYLPSRQSILSVLQEYTNYEDSTEDNNTDQILMEARERLLELERESEVIDEHFETVATFAPSPYECSSNIIVQKFQNNIAMLRNSLKGIFSNITANTGGNIRIRQWNRTPKEYSTDVASFPAMKEFDHYTSKVTSPIGEQYQSHSPVSTVLNINSSMSTVDVSPGNVSEENLEID